MIYYKDSNDQVFAFDDDAPVSDIPSHLIEITQSDAMALANPSGLIQVPVAISPRQARLVLLAAGLLATVEAAIAAMPSPDGDAARIEWEYATEIRRDSALLEALGPQLGLTAEQIDQMFIQAIVL